MTNLYIFVPFVAMFFVYAFNDREIGQSQESLGALKTAFYQKPFPNIKRVVSDLKAKMRSIDTGSDPLVSPPQRSMPDIRGIDQWRSWFEDVLIPNMWDCTQPRVARPSYTQFGKSMPLGAMRLRTFRMTNNSCSANSFQMKDVGSDTPCWGSHDRDKEVKDPSEWCSSSLRWRKNPTQPGKDLLRYYDCSDVAGTFTTGEIGVYHCGGYVVEIPFNTTCDTVRTLSSMLFEPECSYLDSKSTRFVIVEWFLYTPHAQIYESVKLFFEVTATGAWIENHQLRAFRIRDPSDIGTTTFDAFFFAYVLFFFFVMIRDWNRSWRETKRFLAFPLQLWNFLQALNTVTFVVVLTLHWIWVYQSQYSKVTLPFPGLYPVDLDRLLEIYLTQVYANSVNTVITFLQVLRFLRLNDRLNILSRSIAASQNNLIGVIILFVFIVTAFALTGTVLYGVNLREFRNINTAFVTLLKMLLGQIDYSSMRREQRSFTAAFFWSFEVLGLFLLLNFIIAVLCEGFAVASKSVSLAPVLQVVLRQWYEFRTFMTLSNLQFLLLLKLRGKNRQYLWRRAMECLKDHCAMLEPDEAEKVLMFYSDFRQWLPEDVYRDFGTSYCAILWEDIVYDYVVTSTSERGIELETLSDSIQKGVDKAVSHSLEFPSEVMFTLTDIESHVTRILSKVALRRGADEIEYDVHAQSYFANSRTNSNRSGSRRQTWSSSRRPSATSSDGGAGGLLERSPRKFRSFLSVPGKDDDDGVVKGGSSNSSRRNSDSDTVKEETQPGMEIPTIKAEEDEETCSAL
eukprot:PhF_6_TR37614/c0_g1_i1/m.55894